MSSGRQIGSIVGSLIAAYFTAGTSYAALAVAAGGAVGGAIGGAIDPDKVVGPRLEDLKVQYSSYGAGIPTLYGTERFGGNVIWSTDKREVKKTERSGKGGGSVETTSYAYFVNMRILLCETPRDGSTVNIVKIFKDGKLIWDTSSGIPIGSALASANNPEASFILYQGHQDQLPNAEEEAFHGGPGSVSAYRGVVSIYMRDVNAPSGRVPQFSFVLSNSAIIGPTTDLMFSAPSGVLAYGSAVMSEGAWHLISVSGANPAVDVYYGMTGSAGLQRRIKLPFSGLGNFYYTRPIQSQAAGLFFVDDTVSTSIFRVGFSDGSVSLLTTQDGTVNYFGGNSGAAAQDSLTGNYAWMRLGTGQPDAPFLLTNGSVIGIAPFSGTFGPLAFYNGIVYGMQLNAGVLSLALRDGENGAVIGSDIIGPSIPGVVNISRCALQADANGIYALVSVGATALIYSITSSGWTLLVTAPVNLQVVSISANPTFWTNGKSAILANTADATYYFVNFNAITAVEVKAKDIIADQCERAGETRYDVSALPDSDTLYGYKVAIPATSRANIDPILTAFGYFPVDEDGKIKFKRYADITSVATVSYDELGQSDGGETTDTMPLTRTQEIDLPRSVTVSYIDASHDFQTASEKESRQVTSATEDVQIQLAVCTNSDRAKRVAQTVLFDAWRKQNGRHTPVSRKYAYVSPGDGVTIEYPRGTFKLWLVLSTNDTGLLCEWSVAPGDASIFTQTAIGATGFTPQQVSPLAAPARAQILDIPILRDADNNAGPYVAMDSVAAVPANAELFVGDDDTSLQSRGTVSASAPLGLAETVLASWSRNLVDETNIFTVNLGDDVFMSCTRDVLLANGGEFWAYGAPGRWEIGASAQGDSLGGGRYILSRHLRGLFGTENNTGNHEAGDTFVLLRAAGMLRPDTGVGGIGQAKSYRAVTKGRSVNSVASQTYANTGEGLMPLRPINMRRTNSNDLTVDRRSRMAMNNATGALPLGEAQERFSWEFYSSGTFASLLGTVETNSSTVTAAQMTAIGVTPTSTLYVRVSQISDSVGAGHELQASI